MSFLSFQHISKRFPGVAALDDVSFDVSAGTCHALVGENGAGKSTLGKLLAGIHQPDAGEIHLDQARIQPETPRHAHQLGIAMVHQELAFCPNLTVAENLCLHNLPQSAGWVNRREMRRQAARMLAAIESDVDVDLSINQLSIGQEQLVQIAGAVGSGARVIVMDEPTSSLSSRESDHLFSLIRKLKRDGLTILYVSHRMEEIFLLCDTITVLRDGRHAATETAVNTTPERIISQMIGRELIGRSPRHLDNPPTEELLRVENLSSPGKFDNISLNVRRGEVLGFAGLVGSGRTEIAQAIFGLDRGATGRIFVKGTEIHLHSVPSALAHGIGLLPEDRKRLGLVLSMNCRENLSLAALDRLTQGGFIHRARERELALRYLSKLGVKTPSSEAPIAGLSGGNQQKIALAKWLARECEVLIVDEPTRGVDVGAKAEIHRLLDELACQGAAIILISSELPEVMNLSRRIIVMRNGRMMGELPRERFSEEHLMRLMAGLPGF